MLMIRPPSGMSGSARWMMKNGALAFTANIRSNCSGVVSSGPGGALCVGVRRCRNWWGESPRAERGVARAAGGGGAGGGSGPGWGTSRCEPLHRGLERAQQREVVDDAPALSDLAALETEDQDRVVLHRLTGRRHAQELPGVLAPHDPAHDCLVALGQEVEDFVLDVAEPPALLADRQLERLRAGHRFVMTSMVPEVRGRTAAASNLPPSWKWWPWAGGGGDPWCTWVAMTSHRRAARPPFTSIARLEQ